MDFRQVEKEKLKNWFRIFADNECKEVSPFYYSLSNKISLSDELIDIASYCKQGQPMPNLFFAAVHYLLICNPSQELAKYYPSLKSDYLKNLPFQLFIEFCLKHKEAIIEIEQTKIVQTNALNRTAYLMPILSNLFGNKEISIVDIGSSAGLTLNMDKYEYHYNNKYSFGKSSVIIQSEIRKGTLPKFNNPVILKNKIGIDQNPLNLTIIENEKWLKALVWADLNERFNKLSNAINIAKNNPITLLKGSDTNFFKNVIQSQHKELPLVVYHTHTLYQFSQKKREEFWDMIDTVGKKRDLTYIAVEGSKVFHINYKSNGVLVELTEYKNGNKTNKILAETNGHANWIKWEY